MATTSAQQRLAQLPRAPPRGAAQHAAMSNDELGDDAQLESVIEKVKQTVGGNEQIVKNFRR